MGATQTDTKPANATADDKADGAQVGQLTPDEIKRLRAQWAKEPDTTTADAGDEPDDDTDAEVEKLIADAIDDADTELSRTEAESEAIELANAANACAAQLENELAQERGDGEADRYVAAGVPPALVDLARPLLRLPRAATVDLARNG